MKPKIVFVFSSVVVYDVYIGLIEKILRMGTVTVCVITADENKDLCNLQKLIATETSTQDKCVLVIEREFSEVYDSDVIKNEPLWLDANLSIDFILSLLIIHSSSYGN